MRKFVYIAIFLSAFMTACDIETSDNGDLDGFWQLYQLDTLATGGRTDMRDSAVTYSVQVRLLKASYHGTNYLFHFQHQGNLLILKDPYIDNRDEGDIPVTEPSELYRVGIMQLCDTFTINSLSGKRLDMANKHYRLYFRKY